MDYSFKDYYLEYKEMHLKASLASDQAENKSATNLANQLETVLGNIDSVKRTLSSCGEDKALDTFGEYLNELHVKLEKLFSFVKEDYVKAEEIYIELNTSIDKLKVATADLRTLCNNKPSKSDFNTKDVDEFGKVVNTVFDESKYNSALKKWQVNVSTLKVYCDSLVIRIKAYQNYLNDLNTCLPEDGPSGISVPDTTPVNLEYPSLLNSGDNKLYEGKNLPTLLNLIQNALPSGLSISSFIGVGAGFYTNDDGDYVLKSKTGEQLIVQLHHYNYEKPNDITGFTLTSTRREGNLEITDTVEATNIKIGDEKPAKMSVSREYRIFDENGNVILKTYPNADSFAGKSGMLDITDGETNYDNFDLGAAYTYEYDENGNLVQENGKMSYHIEDGIPIADGNPQYVERYYENGNTKSYTSYYENGNMEYSYEYREDGSDKSDAYYYENGNTKIYNFYYKNGAKDYSAHYDENGGLIYKEKYQYRKDGSLTDSTRYNADGKQIRNTDYDKNGRMEHYTDWEHDKYGKLVSSTSYDKNGRITEKTSYQIDEKGRLVGGVSRDQHGEFIESWKYELDEDGNIVGSAKFDEDGNKL